MTHISRSRHFLTLNNEYLRNGTIYRHIYNGILIGLIHALNKGVIRMTFGDLSDLAK